MSGNQFMNLKGFTTQAIYVDRYDSELVRTIIAESFVTDSRLGWSTNCSWVKLTSIISGR